MIVTNSRAKVIRAMNVTFIPGNNIVPENVAELLKKNRGFNTLVSDGTLKVQAAKEAQDQGANEGRLTAAEMVAVVNGMNSLGDLKKLKDEESRKTVIKAIDERIAVLSKSD